MRTSNLDRFTGVYNNGIISAVPDPGYGTCDITFTRNLPGDIEIKRRAGLGTWTALSDLSGSVLNDTGLNIDAEYQYAYRLKGYTKWQFLNIITDSVAASSGASSGGGSSSGSSSATIREKGYQHVTIDWTDDQSQEAVWIIQRKSGGSFTAPDFTLTGGKLTLGWSNFKILGINTERYTDCDNLAESTTYQYRIASITNIRDWARNGTTPTLSSWQEVEVTTDAKDTGWDGVYDITDTSYADSDSLTAFRAAVAAAQAAGGGTVLVPAGNWDFVLPTLDVQQDGGGQLYVEDGDSYSGAFISGNLSNITIKGELDSNGDPATFITLYLPLGRDMDEYLEVLKPGQTSTGDHSTTYVANVVRAHFCILSSGTENFTLKDIDIDGNAYPVNSGKGPDTLDEKREQWDVSHKCIASFTATRNIIIDNVNTRNWRGEVWYTGGQQHEKWLVKNCEIRRTNSSSLSGSYDLEVYNTSIYDSANGAIESAIHDGLTSAFTGLGALNNHLVYNNLFVCIDQSSEGVMKTLSGNKNFAGVMIFNEGVTTCQTLVNNEIRDYGEAGYGPWYACENSFLLDNDFKYPARASKYGCRAFYTDTKPTGLYDIEAGIMHDCLWLRSNLHFDQSLDNGFNLMYSQAQATGTQDDWVIDGLHMINDSGGSISINIIWQDTTSITSGRSNFVWQDWTVDSGISIGSEHFIQGQVDNLVWPEFINCELPRQLITMTVASGNNVNIEGRYVDMNLVCYSYGEGTTMTVNNITNLANYPIGTTFTFKMNSHNAGRGDSIVFPSSGSWNTFSGDKTIDNSSKVLTCQKNTAGTLDFVSLA